MGDQILIIDDDVDLLESLKISLELSGYSVIGAPTGKQAIELYEKHHPAMVFSDVSIPDIDGYELFEILRKIDPLIKMILISGYEITEKSDIAKRNGLLDVLCKPLRLGELQDNIEKIILKTNS